MRGSLRHDAVRLAAFQALCLLGVFGLFAVFVQLRVGKESKPDKAEFAKVTGLEDDNLVITTGVEVGKAKHDSADDDVAVVERAADDTVSGAVPEPPVLHGLLW